MNNNDENYKDITGEESLANSEKEELEETIDKDDHFKYPKYFFVTGVCLCLFLGSYLIATKIINNRNLPVDDDKEVVNSINSNYMSDNTQITLNTQNLGKKELEKQGTLRELSKELKLGNNVTKENMINTLKNQGYELENVENNHYTFTKDTRETLEPNKYYIGTKGEHLAVYTTDDKGKPFIENEGEDVYSNYKTIDLIRSEDREKINKFELKFDTKNKAIEELSAILS